MLKDWPHCRENPLGLHNLEEAITMEDMERPTPRIYAALDNHQEYHQFVVVKVEGMIAKKFIFVLIDPRSTHSYITQKVFESCFLRRMKHNKSWIV